MIASSDAEERILALERAAVRLATRVGRLDAERVPGSEQQLAALWSTVGPKGVPFYYCPSVLVPFSVPTTDSFYGSFTMHYSTDLYTATGGFTFLGPGPAVKGWWGTFTGNYPGNGTCGPVTGVPFYCVMENAGANFVLAWPVTGTGCPTNSPSAGWQTSGATYTTGSYSNIYACSPFSFQGAYAAGDQYGSAYAGQTITWNL